MDLAKEQFEGLKALKERFDQCRSHEVSFKGIQGFFVSTARLDSLDESIKGFLSSLDEDPGKVSTSALSLLDEVDKLRKASAVAESALAAAKEETQRTQVTYKQLKEKNQQLVSEAQKAQDSLKQEKASIQERLTTLQLAHENNKKALNKASKGFDPEVAKEAAGSKANSLAALQDAQQELERVNRALATAHKEKDLASKAIISARAQLTELETKLSAMQAARIEALSEVPLRKVEVEINTPALKLLLGDRGLGWIKKAAEAHEAEVREKLYSMIQATKGHKNNRVISGILSLLEFAFDWVKHQTFKTRMAIQPWVIMIESDLRSGFFKSLAFYRIELEKLIGQIKTKTKQAKDKTKEHFKSARTSYFGWQWFKKEVSYQLWMLKAKTRHVVKRAAHWFKGVYDSWWVAPPGKNHSTSYEKELLFEAELESALLHPPLTKEEEGRHLPPEAKQLPVP